MTAEILSDKKQIFSFLQKDIYLHLYSIGDLDDFFREDSTFFGLLDQGGIKAIILLYTGLKLPTVLSFSDDTNLLIKLFDLIRRNLPEKFYAHISCGLDDHIRKYFRFRDFGKHYKMALKDQKALDRIDCSRTELLTIDDLPAINELYKISFPGNWFDKRMLDTKQYFGIKKDNQLVSIAGIHVYSPEYKVAALGNVTTHPDFRNNGLGKIVIAALCRNLLQTADHIGLNVSAKNNSALSLYKNSGFEITHSYREILIEAKTQ